METNGIVILVLWCVIIISFIINAYYDGKKTETKQYSIIIYLTSIIFIITLLANTAYSIYSTHTDKEIIDDDKNLKFPLLFSSIMSCIVIIITIAFILGKSKKVLKTAKPVEVTSNDIAPLIQPELPTNNINNI